MSILTHSTETPWRLRFFNVCCLAWALLAGFSIVAGRSLLLADESDAAVPLELARWTERSLAYPLKDELRLLATDVVNPAYEQLLERMIQNDLDAEWQRAATADNYQMFLEKNGGKNSVLADPQLKEAYDVRHEIAERFIGLIRAAYKKKNVEPWFNQKQIHDLCANAHRQTVKRTAPSDFSIRALMPVSGADAEWPQYRGPTGQGIVVDKTFPTLWSPDKGILWKKDLPGPGNSSPIVWDKKLFLTAATGDGKQRWLLCYSTETGDLLWQHAAPEPLEPFEGMYGKNTYATSTPVTDGQRVIAFLGNSGMVCCDIDGHELWCKSLGRFPTSFGPGASPVLHGDKVILIQDQNAGDPVFVALDKNNGNEIWRRTRNPVKGWSTPLVVRSGQRDELLHNGAFVFTSFDPDTGIELWRLNGPTRESIPMPVIGSGKIFSVSGRNGPMFGIVPGEKGDVTKTNIVWSSLNGGSHVTTPVCVAGRLFMVSDTGIASCRDAETGDLLWQQRLPGLFSTSILSADDKLIVTNESGTTYLIKASDKFEELGINELHATVIATPAIVRGRIYFRTPGSLICIGNMTP